MDSTQAMAVVALCQSYFPVPELPGATVSTWAEALTPYSYDVGVAGTHRLGRSRVSRGPVQLAELLAECDDVWREAVEQSKADRRAEIVAVQGELMATQDDERSSQILADYFAAFGGDRAERMRLMSAAARGESEAKIAFARHVARMQLEAASNPVAEGQTKPIREPVDARATRSACGAAFGTPSVVRDGVAVCPRCGSPIAEGCGGFAAERARERA